MEFNHYSVMLEETIENLNKKFIKLLTKYTNCVILLLLIRHERRLSREVTQ